AILPGRSRRLRYAPAFPEASRLAQNDEAKGRAFRRCGFLLSRCFPWSCQSFLPRLMAPGGPVQRLGFFGGPSIFSKRLAICVSTCELVRLRVSAISERDLPSCRSDNISRSVVVKRRINRLFSMSRQSFLQSKSE